MPVQEGHATREVLLPSQRNQSRGYRSFTLQLSFERYHRLRSVSEPLRRVATLSCTRQAGHSTGLSRYRPQRRYGALVDMKGSSIKVIFLFVAFSLIQGNPLVFSQAQDSQAPKSSSSSGQEDFTSASLAGSSLRADPPELIDRTDEASYVHEWVTLQWRPDDPVYLYVVRPKGIEKPPVVIYLYDYPAETDTFRDDAWCERAVAGGYAAAGFVPALNGHRYHSLPMKEWFVSRLQ